MHHTSLQKDGGMIMSNRPGGGNSLVVFPKRRKPFSMDKIIGMLREADVALAQRRKSIRFAMLDCSYWREGLRK